MDLKKEISFGSKKAGDRPDKSGKGGAKIPTKTSINLITKERSDIHPLILIPSLVVIILLAVLISKFAVVDLLADLNRAQGRVSTTQALINADEAEIESYGDLNEKYAHYTYSGMNEDELTAVSREEILSLLRDQVMPYAAIGSWSVSYNTVSLPITGDTLQDINIIVSRLNSDDRVDYCTVNTASTDETDTEEEILEDGTVVEASEESTVTARVTIYMKSVEKGAFEG